MVSGESAGLRPLTILGASARNGVSGVVVTGKARNDSGRPLSTIKLVTSFRNTAGEVVGVSGLQLSGYV